MRISKRAAVEKSNLGIGVSSSVRKYWRSYYLSKKLPAMLGRNIQINNIIASDYKSGQLVHRFRLKSGEPCNIVKSHEFYYLGAIRSDNREDIIFIQPRYREASPEMKEVRLSPEWPKLKYMRGK